MNLSEARIREGSNNVWFISKNLLKKNNIQLFVITPRIGNTPVYGSYVFIVIAVIEYSLSAIYFMLSLIFGFFGWWISWISRWIFSRWCRAVGQFWSQNFWKILSQANFDLLWNSKPNFRNLEPTEICQFQNHAN